MAINRIALGRTAEFGQADALKAALAEFISVLIFVFAGEGSGMAFNYESELYISSKNLMNLC
ncbi:hypothetical protein C1H46_015225 [Malus baccata]|uniref:Uncharacterized protein n=1 Tax=Malus baccata TaxID=106549 RepID=A0A540MKB4_MALBA|nr:hypothetical protein C1H46_015225 [Malus baccata]